MKGVPKESQVPSVAMSMLIFFQLRFVAWSCHVRASLYTYWLQHLYSQDSEAKWFMLA